MSETRQIFVESVEEKGGFYVVHSGDVKYGTKEAGIKLFIGKTATFHVASAKKGNYTNWYINAPLPEVPAESSTAPKSMPKENTMVMSYAKDIVVALISSAQLKDAEANAGSKVVEVYNKLLDAAEGSIPF